MIIYILRELLWVKKVKEQKNDSRAKAIMEMFMIAINKKFEPGGEKHGQS